MLIYSEEKKTLAYVLSQVSASGLSRAGVSAAITVFMMQKYNAEEAKRQYDENETKGDRKGRDGKAEKIDVTISLDQCLCIACTDQIEAREKTADREFFAEKVKAMPLLLEWANLEIRDDKNIMLEACRN